MAPPFRPLSLRGQRRLRAAAVHPLITARAAARLLFELAPAGPHTESWCFGAACIGPYQPCLSLPLLVGGVPHTNYGSDGTALLAEMQRRCRLLSPPFYGEDHSASGVGGCRPGYVVAELSSLQLANRLSRTARLLPPGVLAADVLTRLIEDSTDDDLMVVLLVNNVDTAHPLRFERLDLWLLPPRLEKYELARLTRHVAKADVDAVWLAYLAATVDDSLCVVDVGAGCRAMQWTGDERPPPHEAQRPGPATLPWCSDAGDAAPDVVVRLAPAAVVGAKGAEALPCLSRTALEALGAAVAAAGPSAELVVDWRPGAPALLGWWRDDGGASGVTKGAPLAVTYGGGGVVNGPAPPAPGLVRRWLIASAARAWGASAWAAGELWATLAGAALAAAPP